MGSGIQCRYGRQRHGSTQGRAVSDTRTTFAQPACADYKVRTDPEPANAGPARHWLIFPVVSENSCHLKVAIYLTSRRGAIITSQDAENNHLWTYSGAQASRPAPNTKPVGKERHGWLAGNQKPGVTPCAGTQRGTESVAGDAAQVLQMRLGAGRPSEQRDNCLLHAWTRHVPEFWRRIKLRCRLESVHENVGCLLGTPARLIWGDWRESKSESKEGTLRETSSLDEYVLFDTFNRKQ
jgi:hypothetical protein